jgi:hypothetical protein
MSVTWNSKPDIWTYSGLFIPLVTDVGTRSGTYTWNVTRWVQDWWRGDYPNYGLMIMPLSEDVDSYSSFYSKEYYEYDIRRPRLEVSYESATPPPSPPPIPPPEPPDTAPPTVTISITPPTNIKPTDWVNIAATATDDVGLGCIDLTINPGGISQRWSTSEPGVLEHSIPPYSGRFDYGTYDIVAQAWDRAGLFNGTCEQFQVMERPKLEILSIEPVTQHGSTLIAHKQAIFKFNYILESSSQINVFVGLKLPKLYWYSTLHTSEDDQYYIIQDSVTLHPTTPSGDPNTAYLLDDLEGMRGRFLPQPKYKTRIPIPVYIEVDPFEWVNWDDRSILSRQESFYPHYPRKGEWIEIVFFEVGGGDGILGAPRYTFHFTDAQKIELVSKLISEPHFSGTPKPYALYLSSMFPATFVVNPDGWSHWFTGNIGWWDADTLGEIAADEGYSRVVAICPPGAIAAKEGAGTIGVVYHRFYGRYDQSYYTAFVEYEHALDPGRYIYFPVVAHELSHTYRFPDIYGHDRQIVVDFDYAYFDEIQGGIVKIFKRDKYLPSGTTPRVVKGEGLEEVSVPTYISAWDIMHYAGRDRSEYWTYASYDQVADQLHEGEDPPEGLLISMIVFKNGTVVGRPFQKIYDHSFRYPETEGTGNFWLILYDRNGEVLRQYPYTIEFYYTVEPIGEKPADAMPFVTLVEWNDDLGRIEFVDSGGEVWFRRDVSVHAPVLEVIYPLEGEMLGIDYNYTLLWNGTDADGDSLWYTVLLRKESDDVWRSLASRIREEKMFFAPSAEFEEGNYQVQIKATDGVNTAVKFVNVSIATAATVTPMPEPEETLGPRPSPTPIDLYLIIVVLGAAIVIAVLVAVAMKRRKKM